MFPKSIRFYKNSVKNCKILQNFAKILHFFWNFPQFFKIFAKFREILQNFANLLARRWFSCRAWKMLKNAYLDAKIGVDPAENEARKEWWCRGPTVRWACRARWWQPPSRRRRPSLRSKTVSIADAESRITDLTSTIEELTASSEDDEDY